MPRPKDERGRASRDALTAADGDEPNHDERRRRTTPRGRRPEQQGRVRDCHNLRALGRRSAGRKRGTGCGWLCSVTPASFSLHHSVRLSTIVQGTRTSRRQQAGRHPQMSRLGADRRAEFVTLAKENRVSRNGPFWAAVSAYLAVFAGGKMALPHDLGPPRAVLSTFLQRWRTRFCATAGQKGVPPRNPPPRHELPSPMSTDFSCSHQPSPGRLPPCSGIVGGCWRGYTH